MTTNFHPWVYLTLLASVALVASLLVGVAPLASATPTWSVSATPNSPGATKSELLSVSCPSTTFCVAVGDATNGHQESLVERWNGGSWAIMHSLDAIGFTSATLAGVSCPSTTNCFAVGSFSTFGVGETLAEHWNGRRWAIMSSPSPGARFGSQIDLNAVSCPTTESCFAVGSSGQGLIEHWDGSHWKEMTAPIPHRAMGSNLLSVSCASAKSCVAVGSFWLTSVTFLSYPLIEHWNGTRWTIMSEPYIGPGVSVPGEISINAVSCPSATRCFAVGSFNGLVSFGEYALQWNGRGDWSGVDSPGLVDNLTGVACASTTNCFAVSYDASLEHWDGARWSIVTLNRPRTYPFLNGVSCASTSRCFAVGRTRHDSTLVWRYA